MKENKRMKYELKPCPFCGSEVKMTQVPLWHGSHGYHGCYDFTVRCEECGCTLDFYKNDTIYRSEDEAENNAIKTWNQRAK
jgi:Lar family restriction alleviation protein